MRTKKSYINAGLFGVGSLILLLQMCSPAPESTVGSAASLVEGEANQSQLQSILGRGNPAISEVIDLEQERNNQVATERLRVLKSLESYQVTLAALRDSLMTAEADQLLKVVTVQSDDPNVPCITELECLQSALANRDAAGKELLEKAARGELTERQLIQEQMALIVEMQPLLLAIAEELNLPQNTVEQGAPNLFPLLPSVAVQVQLAAETSNQPVPHRNKNLGDVTVDLKTVRQALPPLLEKLVGESTEVFPCKGNVQDMTKEQQEQCNEIN